MKPRGLLSSNPHHRGASVRKPGSHHLARARMDLQPRASRSVIVGACALTDHSRSALDLKPAALPVVLAGSYADRTQLLAIGLASAVADLEPYRTLAFASTFGEARRFLGDLEQMDGALERYIEGVMTPDDDWDEDELVLRERYAGDASPFDAAEYFGEQLGWIPQARLTSADWLKQCAPQVFSEFAQEDTGGGFDYDSAPSIPAEDRAEVELALTAAGLRVRHCEDIYLEPRQDWRDVVAVDSHG